MSGRPSESPQLSALGIVGSASSSASSSSAAAASSSGPASQSQLSKQAQKRARKAEAKAAAKAEAAAAAPPSSSSSVPAVVQLQPPSLSLHASDSSSGGSAAAAASASVVAPLSKNQRRKQSQAAAVANGTPVVASLAKKQRKSSSASAAAGSFSLRAAASSSKSAPKLKVAKLSPEQQATRLLIARLQATKPTWENRAWCPPAPLDIGDTNRLLFHWLDKEAGIGFDFSVPCTLLINLINFKYELSKSTQQAILEHVRDHEFDLQLQAQDKSGAGQLLQQRCPLHACMAALRQSVETPDRFEFLLQLAELLFQQPSAAAVTERASLLPYLVRGALDLRILRAVERLPQLRTPADLHEMLLLCLSSNMEELLLRWLMVLSPAELLSLDLTSILCSNYTAPKVSALTWARMHWVRDRRFGGHKPHSPESSATRVIRIMIETLFAWQRSQRPSMPDVPLVAVLAKGRKKNTYLEYNPEIAAEAARDFNFQVIVPADIHVWLGDLLAQLPDLLVSTRVLDALHRSSQLKLALELLQTTEPALLRLQEFVVQLAGWTSGQWGLLDPAASGPLLELLRTYPPERLQHYVSCSVVSTVLRSFGYSYVSPSPPLFLSFFTLLYDTVCFQALRNQQRFITEGRGVPPQSKHNSIEDVLQTIASSDTCTQFCLAALQERQQRVQQQLGVEHADTLAASVALQQLSSQLGWRLLFDAHDPQRLQRLLWWLNSNYLAWTLTDWICSEPLQGPAPDSEAGRRYQTENPFQWIQRHEDPKTMRAWLPSWTRKPIDWSPIKQAVQKAYDTWHANELPKVSKECGLSDALPVPDLALIVWQYTMPLTSRQQEQARAQAEQPNEEERKGQD